MVKKNKGKRKPRNQAGAQAASPVAQISGYTPSRYGEGLFSKTNILFFGLLIALLVPSILHGSKGTPFIEHSFLKDAFIATTLAIAVLIWAVVSLFSKGPLRIPFSYFGAAMLLLVIYGVVSLFWSNNTGHLIQKLIIWLGGAFAFVVAFLESENKQKRNLILWAVALAGFFTAVVGAGQYIFNLDFVAQASKPAATFGNRNMATHLVMFALPAALYLLFSSETRKTLAWKDLLCAAAVFAMLLFVFQTGTRSAWLGVIAQAVLIIAILVVIRLKGQWTTLTNHRRNAAIIIAFIAVFPFTFFKYDVIQEGESGVTLYNPLTRLSANVDRTLGQLTEDNKATRLFIWGASRQTFEDKPLLGWGLGNWNNAYRTAGHLPEPANSSGRAHNDVVELAVELGALGLVILAIAGLLLVYQGFKLVFFGRDKEQLLLMTFMLPAVAGTALQAQFSFPYQLAVPTLTLGAYLGLICATYQREFAGRQSLTIAPNLRYLMVFFVSLMAVFVLYANSYWKSVIAQINNNYLAQSWTHIPLEENSWLENRYFYTILFGFTKVAANRPALALKAYKNMEDAVLMEYIPLERMALHYVNHKDVNSAIKYLEKASVRKPVGSSAIVSILERLIKAHPKKKPQLTAFLLDTVVPMTQSENKETVFFYMKIAELLLRAGEPEAADRVFERAMHWYADNPALEGDIEKLKTIKVTQ